MTIKNDWHASGEANINTIRKERRLHREKFAFLRADKGDKKT